MPEIELIFRDSRRGRPNTNPLVVGCFPAITSNIRSRKE
jgi:hypothetical protein